MITYVVTAVSGPGVIRTFEYPFYAEYAHSTHLVEIMRNLDDMYLDLLSITVKE